LAVAYIQSKRTEGISVGLYTVYAKRNERICTRVPGDLSIQARQPFQGAQEMASRWEIIHLIQQVAEKTGLNRLSAVADYRG
jgi:hypothetical protein